jgi:hypothetical protein
LGQPFNSIVAIEQYKGAEMNALVNPGAIAAASMVQGRPLFLPSPEAGTGACPYKGCGR